MSNYCGWCNQRSECNCWRRRLWNITPEFIRNIYRRKNIEFPFGGE